MTQLVEGNNFKNAVRVGARRYYFHNRVSVSHDDLWFCRTDTSHPDQPLTTDESNTFTSRIGLSGAIVKFGEDLRTLTPEQINNWRRILPTYVSDAARPLDLFTRTIQRCTTSGVETPRRAPAHNGRCSVC